MKQCPHCSSQLQENATFCPYCMTSLDEKITVTSRKMPVWIRQLLLGVLVVALIGAVVLLLPKEQPGAPTVSENQSSPPVTQGQEGVPPPSSSAPEPENESIPMESVPDASSAPQATTPPVEVQQPVIVAPVTTPTVTEPPETEPEIIEPEPTEDRSGYIDTHPIYTFKIMPPEEENEHGIINTNPSTMGFVMLTDVKVAQDTYIIPYRIRQNGMIYFVKTIEPYAFAGTGAKTVYVGNAGCQFLSNAFYGCHLTDLYIGDSFSMFIQIASDAFGSLETIHCVDNLCLYIKPFPYPLIKDVSQTHLGAKWVDYPKQEHLAESVFDWG